MIYTLILTLQSSHVNGGVSIHSIDFNDERSAYDAGSKWKESLRRESVSANYVVVVKQ